MSGSDFFQQVKNAIKKLIHLKSSTNSGKMKEVKYLSALTSLQTLVFSPSNLENIKRNWKRLVGEFYWNNSFKNNQALRDDFARCLGKIGFLIGDNEFENFLQLLRNICIKSRRQEERCFYLYTLSECITCFCGTNFRRSLSAEHLQSIMNFTRTYLDDNDSPFELIPLLDICEKIARFYPNDFSPYLHDICDFVIGWYMDQNQPVFVENKCREMISIFKPFFHANISEAIGFLMSLIDDLLFNVGQLTKDDKVTDSYFIFSNVISILVVFDDICQNSLSTDNFSFFHELVQKLFDNMEEIILATEKFSGKLGGVTFLHLANVLSRIIEINSVKDRDELLDKIHILATKALASSLTSKHNVLSIICISEKIVEHHSNLNKEEFVKIFVGFGKSESCLKFMDAETCAAMSALFSKMLNPSELNTLQSNYKYLVENFQNEFKSLRECLDGEFLSGATRKRSLFIIAMLSSLDSIVVAKNSIIVLRGLDPSLFSLLFTILPLQEKWLVTYFVDTFLCLLSLAKKFAETHNQFIANSDLFTSPNTKTSFYIESPAAKNFEQILNVLSTLLEICVGISGDSGENLLMEWLDAVNQCITAEMAKSSALENNTAVFRLRRALLIVFVEQKIARKTNYYKILLTSIHRFSAFSALSDDLYSREFSYKMFEKAEKMGSEQFFKLLMHLPSSFFLGCSFAKFIDDVNFVEQEPLGKSTMGTFYFGMLTNFLAHDVVFFPDSEQNNKMDLAMVERLYIDLQTNSNSAFLRLNQKWVFIAQQYALFCIENRLRTPIGKAVDTFTKFEGIVSELLKEVDHENCNFKNNEDGDVSVSTDNIKRVTFVLEMMDAFDKLMNFSTRGSSLYVSNISTASRLFFQTNESTWQGWLTRISMSLMSICFETGRFSQIVRLADNLFADVEQRFLTTGKALKMDSVTLSVVCWLIRSYVELSAPHAIRGVKRWLQKMFHLDINWIDCAENLALYNYESAMAGFCEILKNERLHDCVARALCEMCVKAIKALRNIEFSIPFRETLQQSMQRNKVKMNDNVATDFENNNLDFLKLQLDSALTLSSWSNLEVDFVDTNTNHNNFDLTTALDHAEFSLLQAFTGNNSKLNFCSKSNLSFELENKFSRVYQMILTENRDDCKILNAKAAVLKQVFAVIKAEEKRNKGDNYLLQKSNSFEKSIASNYFSMGKLWEIVIESPNLEISQMLCNWLSRLYSASSSQNSEKPVSFFSRNYNTSSNINNANGSALYRQPNLTPDFNLALRPALVAAHAEMAHIAAKTGNVALSQFHLRKYSEVLASVKINETMVEGSYNSKLHNLQLSSPLLHSSYIQQNAPPSFICSNGKVSGLEALNSKVSTVDLPSTNTLDTNASLKTFLRTAKITWNFDSNAINGDYSVNSGVRSDCFRNMINVLCAHSLSAEAKFAVQGSFESTHQLLLGKLCTCLGRWSRDLPNSFNMLFQIQKSSPHAVLQKVLHYCEQLNIDCVGIDTSEILRGSFFLTASNSVAPRSIDVFYTLANWSFEQMYYDGGERSKKLESTIFASKNEDTTDDISEILRVSANESALFRRMGINLDVNNGKRFLSLLGKCKTVEALKQAIKSTMNLEENSLLLSTLSLSDFLQTWTLIKLRQFKFFEIALNSSLRLLENSSAECGKNSIKVISTTLRVLNFLASQPEWFKRIVEPNWLMKMDATVWKDVILQTFAYLKHTDGYVRQIALQILSHIGESQPHVVCYPAVINASPHLLAKITSEIISDKNKFNKNEVSSGDDKILISDTKLLALNNSSKAEEMNFEDELIMANLCISRRNSYSQSQVRLQEFSGRLVEFLKRKFPRLVCDVVEFCSEMQKINVLREERWLFSLTRIENALTKRRSEAETEFRKQFIYDHLTDEQKSAGIRQRHEAIALPAYEKLKNLFETTCMKAEETENDKNFCSIFKIHLEQALEHFYDNRFNLQLAIEPFRKIMSMITTRAMKRSSLSLSIENISPYLANLASSNVPIPGQEFELANGKSTSIITIQKVHKTVFILPTKTRPKKITFTGSDGKNYTFLFKGHEDLRLDERVMQLSRICNTVLQSAKRNPSLFSSWDEFFSVSTYSVTPLGCESGLIEWVDGATPLFQLYRKWKIREVEGQESRRQQAELKSKTGSAESPTVTRKLVSQKAERVSPAGEGGGAQIQGGKARTPEPTRPTEMFYAKLKSVLVEENLSTEILRDRRRWPLSCLEKVFDGLVKETPRDILAKELWMRAGNSAAWWRVTRRFARSMAVASIVGWTVLGLGDRHLDNLLVDVRTGRVVHVDYNVCFEKGRTLRVPETVPFRLTGNIVRALGPTGTEGVFRESAIHVLVELRANKKILFSMLGANSNFENGMSETVRDTQSPTRTDCLISEVGDSQQKLVASTQNPIINNNNHQQDVSFFASAEVTQAIRRKLSGRELIDRLCREDEANLLTSLSIITDGETEPMLPDKHVDYLIEKATNSTNLALLYEGWTAWV